MYIFTDICIYKDYGDEMMERWGDEFIDNRNWSEYNEKLVVRGEFLLDMEWVKSWDKELEKMNEGKMGAPFEYPESLIKLQAVWHQWIDYRGLEGVTRKLANHDLVPKCNDFSTINRRVNEIEIDFKLPESGSVCASTDGSGMKMSNGGEYRERKYGKGRKKYTKVTITADPKKRKLLGCDVSIEGEGDSEPDVAKKHMEELKRKGKKIRKFWGDGAFDSKDLFDFLERNEIKSAVKIRDNSTIKNDGSARDKEVIDYKKKGYKKWAKEREDGLRWIGTEGIFSAVKRKFGENVRATKIENMMKEVKMKFWVYDLMSDYPFL